jgi:hypothetical protein
MSRLWSSHTVEARRRRRSHGHTFAKTLAPIDTVRTGLRHFLPSIALRVFAGLGGSFAELETENHPGSRLPSFAAATTSTMHIHGVSFDSYL